MLKLRGTKLRPEYLGIASGMKCGRISSKFGHCLVSFRILCAILLNLLAKSARTLLIVSVLFILSPKIALSEVRSSTNFRIFSDTLSSGGEYSTSTNFRAWDAVGEILSDENSTSTNFRARLGFEALIPDDVLTVTLPSSVDLGDLSSSAVTSQDVGVTYATNANGFTSTIREDGDLRISGGESIDDVSDGTVSVGQEEYGIRTSGSMGQQNSADTSITTTAKTIASRSDPTTGASITLTFKVAVLAGTPTGNYSHEVTVTTSGNF